MYTRTIVVLAVVALFAAILCSGCSGEVQSQALPQFRDGAVGVLQIGKENSGMTYFNVVRPDSSTLLNNSAALLNQAVVTVTNREVSRENTDLLNGKMVLVVGTFRYHRSLSFCDTLEVTILGDDPSIVAASGGMRYLRLSDGSANIAVTQQSGEDVYVGVVTRETEVIIRGRNNLKREDLDLLEKKKVAVHAEVAAGETGEEPQISRLVVTVLEVL